MFKKGTLSWDESGNKEEGEDPVTRPQQVAAAMQLMVFGDNTWIIRLPSLKIKVITLEITFQMSYVVINFLPVSLLGTKIRNRGYTVSLARERTAS